MKLTRSVKIIYWVLIICIGGIGPSAYFDAFRDHHDHPYHLAIFEGGFHSHNPLPLPPELVAEWVLESHLQYYWATQSEAITKQNIDPVNNFARSGLAHGYLLVKAMPNSTAYAEVVGDVVGDVLILSSAWLPPPLKPPILI